MPGAFQDQDKAAIRRALRRHRKAYVASLTAEERIHLSERLARTVPPWLRGARVVASYVATGDEIDPTALVDELRAGGAQLALPRVMKRSDAMTFHLVTDRDLAREPGHAGIPLPLATAPLVDPDLIVVPLVAADLGGHRIGQGGGHYDRVLADLRARGQVTAVGVAWDAQVVDALSPDAWDARLDAVVTPTRWIDCR